MEDKTVCIIPARGGSKRIPRKNLLLLNGKPLVAYTIEAAVKSKCFSDVYVSSDEPKILEIAENCGAQIDRRPDRLSGDTVKAVEVVDEFVRRQHHRDKWDNIAMSLPTCPFRRADDLRQAMELFLREKSNCPRLIGATQSDFPPQLALKQLAGTSLVEMREPNAYGLSTRSQDLDALYFPNGSIYISTAEAYLKTKTFFGNPMLVHIMPAECSIDIDYPYQFKIAEFLMQEKMKDQKDAFKNQKKV